MERALNEQQLCIQKLALFLNYDEASYAQSKTKPRIKREHIISQISPRTILKNNELLFTAHSYLWPSIVALEYNIGTIP